MELAGKQIAVLGAGGSGYAAAALALSRGASVRVFDSGAPEKLAAAVEKFEALGAPLTCGEAALTPPHRFDLIVLSPGIDTVWPIARDFAAASGEMIGEIEFAWRFSDIPVIGITGTNGKSTCTELIAHIFEACGKRSIPCGNHGISLSEVVASGEHYDVLALEISSFQLETIQNFRAKASLWLNFAPDHLDRYPGMPEYFAAKARIFENVTAEDVAIVRAGECISSGKAKRLTFSAYGAEANAVYSKGEFFVDGQRIGDASAIRLRGRHNMENILAGMMACHVHGVYYTDALAAVASYVPPAHRCELVRLFNDREYINDSKATNLHALEACIGAMDRPIVLIAGGKQKGLDYTPLRASLNGQVRAMVLIGEIKQLLHDTFADLLPCRMAADMADAVKIATELSQPGDSIILSPGKAFRTAADAQN